MHRHPHKVYAPPIQSYCPERAAALVGDRHEGSSPLPPTSLGALPPTLLDPSQGALHRTGKGWRRSPCHFSRECHGFMGQPPVRVLCTGLAGGRGGALANFWRECNGVVAATLVYMSKPPAYAEAVCLIGTPLCARTG
jgi:hypothetical protein